MKTITGKILSSKTVSVAQARSFLSEFVNTDTGASQAVTAYLRRAASAFDELLRVHSKSQRLRGDGEEKGEEKVGLVNNGGLEGKREIEAKEEDEKKSKKKKKKMRERANGGLEENVSVVRDSEVKKDGEGPSLKRKSGGDEEEQKEVGTEERKQSKKKKKRRKDGEDNV